MRKTLKLGLTVGILGGVIFLGYLQYKLSEFQPKIQITYPTGKDAEIVFEETTDKKSEPLIVQHDNENSDTETEKQDNTSQTLSRRLQEFEEAINAKNYSNLSQYFASNVEFIVEASGAVGVSSPQMAVEGILEFARLKKGTTLFEKGLNPTSFNFSQDSDVVKRIKNMQGFSVRLDEYIIGIGNNNAVFGYHVDNTNKIDKVYLAVSVSFILGSGYNLPQT